MTMQMQIPEMISGQMSEESLERLARNLYKAKDEDMREIPLWLLEDLAITCKQLHLENELNKVLTEIKLNLEAQRKADLAEQELKEAILLNQQVKTFMSQIKKKYGINI
ncbi:hypothetical protein [Campylobacter molothri]|uniref:hypothetical protein n=1 Tax=Campylobacter molothri TaxID=1032242 RepID=UPI00301CD21F|nr:hypothetical protein [Campylobacter sp. W0067]